MLRLLLLGLSRLPRWLLYRFADGMALLMCYVLRYRRRVIMGGLSRSFPNKSPRELRRIARQFYWNLADVLVEMLMLFTMKEKEFRRRVKYHNLEEVEKHFAAGRPVIHYAIHTGNWEFLPPGHTLYFSAPLQAAFVPISQPIINELMQAARQRYGAEMIPRKDTVKRVLSRGQEPRSIGLVGDQCPKGPAQAFYWSTFLNQPTAFFIGPEKIAHKLNAAVFFQYAIRTKRGHYEVFFEEIDAPPFHPEPHYITEEYIRRSERVIAERPQEWLWSHKRWKMKPPPDLVLPPTRK